MDKRKRDLDSVKRYAHWLTQVENEGEWITRNNWCHSVIGSVVELELGYRSASYFLNAPSCGSWVA